MKHPVNLPTWSEMVDGYLKSACGLSNDYSGTCHPWDHAKWLLYRGGLLIEVGGALGLY